MHTVAATCFDTAQSTTLLCSAPVWTLDQHNHVQGKDAVSYRQTYICRKLPSAALPDIRISTSSLSASYSTCVVYRSFVQHYLQYPHVPISSSLSTRASVLLLWSVWQKWSSPRVHTMPKASRSRSRNREPNVRTAGSAQLRLADVIAHHDRRERYRSAPGCRI